MTPRHTLLLANRRGISAVEFGLLAPVLCMTLLALGDFTHRSYVQGLVDGEMQKAARSSAIEGGARNAAEIDKNMHAMIRSINVDAEIKTERESFATFQSINPERYTDANANGERDPGECFDDVNGNKQWDARPYRKGQGGAHDVTILRTTVTWPPMFPLAGFLGLPGKQKIVVKTILKNQPFAGQAGSSTEEVCK